MKATWKMTTDEAVDTVNALKCKPEWMFLKWKQFHKCKAYVATYSPQYDVIKSYTTIVGLVDKEAGYLYELGKWSQTTSQQIRKIWHEMYDYTTEFVPCDYMS